MPLKKRLYKKKINIKNAVRIFQKAKKIPSTHMSRGEMTIQILDVKLFISDEFTDAQTLKGIVVVVSTLDMVVSKPSSFASTLQLSLL